MKIKLFLLAATVFTVSIIATASNGVAANYDIGVEEGDQFIWKCTICDKEKMEDLFGKDWNSNGTGLFEELERGTRMKFIIKEIDEDTKIYNPKSQENEEFFSITFKKWIWTDEDKSFGDDDYVEQMTHYTDPKDFSDDLIFQNFAPIWLPIPIGDYLKEVDLYEGYSIDARSISALNCEIEKYDLEDDYPTEFIKIQAMYNDQGILRSYKLYIEDNQIIVEIFLENDFVFFPMIIEVFIPVIIGIFYIGLLYFIYKKILIG